MPLHRDIFWLGRQWAVTGFGMQAINQKYDGRFDIPIERLWDDALPEGVSDQKWFNPDDFSKALAIARARHVRPPPKPAASPPPVETPRQSSPIIAAGEPAALPVISAVEAASIPRPEAVPEALTTPPKQEPSPFEMRILAHPAKLLRVWRARRLR